MDLVFLGGVRGVGCRCVSNRHQTVSPQPLLVCHPEQSIKEMARKLIETPTSLVAIMEHSGGEIKGIVTLHDLLRAETSLLE
ncbi:MAG: CBS domain-containing protein [Verrucomicrobiae bacterium]|nr:CBS domain-containing protein [Verrucomicrobiae bacterium]